MRRDGRDRPSERTEHGRALKAAREQRAVERLRAQVFALLGGDAAACAAGCGNTGQLEPDHMHGRNWSPRKLGPRTRWRRYLADARAGLLRLLCRSCNARDGRERMLAAREAREREDAAAFAEMRRAAAGEAVR